MPDRAGGGWYPPDHGLSPADEYAAWLHEHGYEDSPARRAEFAAQAAFDAFWASPALGEEPPAPLERESPGIRQAWRNAARAAIAAVSGLDS